MTTLPYWDTVFKVVNVQFSTINRKDCTFQKKKYLADPLNKHFYFWKFIRLFSFPKKMNYFSAIYSLLALSVVQELYWGI